MRIRLLPIFKVEVGLVTLLFLRVALPRLVCLLMRRRVGLFPRISPFLNSFSGTGWVLLAVLSVATVSVISILLLRVPQWQASIASIRDAKDRVAAENDVFRNIIQTLGGA